MQKKNFIIATAGHVDHGKSSLVKALTGTDPDRLPEEKERGITIDLGFASFSLATAEETLELGVVDVPGHEDFVKNMVAGVGFIDLALMVVAADDGWMPQTEEHLQILSYLEVKNALVALTKIDLNREHLDETMASVRDHLNKSPFANAPIVPVSVLADEGLTELKSHLLELLKKLPAPRNIGKPRLAVDRVFSLHGVGTIVTGTLIGGELNRSQSVSIQPQGKSTRIRSLQNHHHEVEKSGPGQRTALNLTEVEAGIKLNSSSSAVYRGDVITLPELGQSSRFLHVALERSSRLRPDKPESRPLRDGTRAWFHHGTSKTEVVIKFLEKKEMLPGDRVLSELRLSRPLFVFSGDRFIIRDWSEQRTLGGGLVLNPDGESGRMRSSMHQSILKRRFENPDRIEVWVETEVEEKGLLDAKSLLLKSSFSVQEIFEAVEALVARGAVLRIGSWITAANWWKGLRSKAAELVAKKHKLEPQAQGLPLSELRSAMAPDLPFPEAFDILMHDLQGQGFNQSGNYLKDPRHRPALPPTLAGAGEKIRTILSAKPFDPPSRKEVAPDQQAQQALRFLRETGEVTEVGTELVLLSENFQRMKKAIIEHLRARGPSTVSDLRQMLGTSRRVIMPILENLDREGWTLRTEDKRTLGKKGLSS